MSGPFFLSDPSLSLNKGRGTDSTLTQWFTFKKLYAPQREILAKLVKLFWRKITNRLTDIILLYGQGSYEAEFKTS